MAYNAFIALFPGFGVNRGDFRRDGKCSYMGRIWRLEQGLNVDKYVDNSGFVCG